MSTRPRPGPRRTLALAPLIAVLATAAGCGQKGPLYLPEQQPAEQEAEPGERQPPPDRKARD